jgi:hypothetical protein
MHLYQQCVHREHAHVAPRQLFNFETTRVPESSANVENSPYARDIFHRAEWKFVFHVCKRASSVRIMCAECIVRAKKMKAAKVNRKRTAKRVQKQQAAAVEKYVLH